MNETPSSRSKTAERPTTIGRMALKKRQELERLKDEQRRLQQIYREEKEKLERDLAEADRRDRRRESLARQNDDKRMRFTLGGLMLDNLRAQGVAAFSLGPMDLARLKEIDRQLLDGILARAGSTPPTPASSPNQDAADAEILVDVPL